MSELGPYRHADTTPGAATGEASSLPGVHIDPFDGWRTEADRIGELTSQKKADAEYVSNQYGLHPYTAWDERGTSLAFIYETASGPYKLPIDPKADLERQMSRMVNQTEAALERKYNIHFYRSGEEVVDQRLPQGSRPQAPIRIAARNPTFTELSGLEEALETSLVSLPKPGEPSLNIAFLAARENPEVPSYASFMGSLRGHPTLLFQDPPTSGDSPDDPQNNRRSLKFQFNHEFGHRAQQKLWGDYYGPPQEVLKGLGWNAGLRPTVDGGVKLSPRLTMQDGSGYCLMTDLPKYPLRNQSWITCDPPGEPLSRILHPRPSEILPTTEVRQRAMVKPPSNYFINPTEEHAEGLAYFRTSERTRAYLLHSDRNVYNLIKQEDERDIRTSGRQLMRLPNGRLVPPSDGARRAIEEFER